MDRIIYTFEQVKEPDKGSAEAITYGSFDLTIRSDKKNLEQTKVRAIRSYDSILVFEGNTNASGKLRINLPICAHKTAENYTFTINYNGFPTKIFTDILITPGKTTSKTVQIGL